MRIKQGSALKSIACLIGFSASLASLILDHDLRLGETSILGCGLAFFSGCSKVALSIAPEAWGRFSLGALGMAYFAFYLFGWSFGIKRRVLILLSNVSVFYALLLLLYSLIILRTFCTYCLVIDIALLCLLFENGKTIFSLWLPKLVFTTKNNLLPLLFSLIYFFALSIVFETMTFNFFKQKRHWQDNPVHFKLTEMSKANDVPTTSGISFLSAAGRNTLHFYGDFKCFYCRDTIKNLKEAIDLSGASIRGIFHPYPQESSCNPYSNLVGHQGACVASKIALCTVGRNDLNQVIDFLFQETNRISADSKQTLQYIENSAPYFHNMQACIDSSATTEKLKDEIETARKIGVIGTPTFIMNDRAFSGSPTRREWLQILKQLPE